MGIFNHIEYDGANSLDNGVYISGEGAYNAPERAVEKISIPGRNGDLIIDRGRFENIEVSYPAGVFGSDQSEFAAKVRAYRNKLASSRSYKRLTDSYHPDEFRLALFKDGLEVEPTNYNRAGEFEIVFDCKPQRFLVSGETPVSYPRAWGQTETVTGNPAEFEADESTGVKSLEVDLEPIQDLNGYSKPWVGGSGKNLLENTATTTTKQGLTYTVNSDGSVTVNGTATANSYLAIPVNKSFASAVIVNGCPTPVQSGVYIQAVDSDSTTYDDTGNGVTVPSGKTITYVRCRINNGVTVSNKTFYPMIRLASVTDATFEPYSNICPISGHTSVETVRTGKNLCPIATMSTTNGGYINSSTGIIGEVVAGQTYTLSLHNNTERTSNLTVRMVVNGAWSNLAQGNLVANGKKTYTFTAEHSGEVSLSSFLGTDYSPAFTELQIELGSTATAYEPYQGETFTTDLGRTVYGGTLDLVSGVLTVDRAMVDLGTLTWTRNTSDYSYAYFYSGGISGYTAGELVCSHYPFATGGKAGLTTDKTVAYYSASSTRIALRDDDYTDATAFKTAMSGVQCVYPLLNPQTYQLTPQEVEALVGENVVWSDGTVTIQYGEDPEKIVNPTLFPSNPLIALTGSGTVTIGDTTITSTAPTGTTVYIDCESKEIYYYLNGALTNGSTFISFSGNDFPVIEAGTPKVTRTGTIGIVITPRWWLV